jgi:hypothetical protein
VQLFIGNCSKQFREIFFRLPEDDPRNPFRKMVLSPGEQKRLPGTAPKDFLDNEKYGWREASSVSRQREFVGILYSFDKPITENALTYVIDANDGKLDEAAVEERKRMAVAASQMAMSHQDGRPIPKEFEMSIRQTSGDAAEDAGFREEGVRVVADGGAKPGRGRRRAS